MAATQDITLYDEAGNPVAVVPGDALPTERAGLIVLGSDGTNVRELKTDANGQLFVANPGGSSGGDADDTSVPVPLMGNFIAGNEDGTTKIITATTVGNDKTLDTTVAKSVLPDGAATQATLAAVLADTTSLDGKDFATQTTLANVLSDTALLVAKDFATQTTLAAVLADTTSLDGKDFATQTTLAAADTKLDAIKTSTELIDDTIVTAGADNPDPVKGQLIAGTDGLLTHVVKTDDVGRLDVVGGITGTVGIADTGFVRTSAQDVATSISFRHNFQRVCRRIVIGPTATLTIVDRKARLATGTAVGYAYLHQQPHFPSVLGAVLVNQMVLSGAAAVAGNVRRWGAGNLYRSSGAYFRLDGTSLEIVIIEDGVEIHTVAANQWSEISDITWDTKVHQWSVHHQQTGAGTILFARDGELVHVHNFAEEDLIGKGNYNIAPHILNENTSIQASSVDLDIVELGTFYEGARILDASTKTYRITNSEFIYLGSGVFQPVLGLEMRHDAGHGDDYRHVQIKAVRVGCAKDGKVRVRLNSQITGTAAPFGQVQNPDDAWAGMAAPLTEELTGDTTTGTGYADGDSVSYKVAALAPTGETLASTATADIADVGTPKESVKVSWQRIGLSAGYNIYRQVNGTGTYDLIGTTRHGHFTDKAYVSRDTQPPVTNTTHGNNRVDWYDEPTSIVGGRIIGTVRLAAFDTTAFVFGSREVLLHPGETLSVEFDPDQVTEVMVEVHWEEVVY